MQNNQEDSHQKMALEQDIEIQSQDQIPASTTEKIDWDDPREKRNPHNWHVAYRILHSVVPCVLTFWITFGTSVVTPAIGALEIQFNISRTKAILTLTCYTLGLAFGPLFIAPLSELYGRRWVYIITSSCLLAFTGGASAAHNFATLLVCRFFAGFLGSAAVAIGAGTIGDVWGFGKTGVLVGLGFILGPFLGPSLGPLAGAYVLYHHDNNWRWTMYLLLILGAPICVGTYIMQETSKERILRKELEPLDRSKIDRPFHTFLQFSVVRPVKMLCTEVIVFSLTIYTAFAYAMIFSYFGSASYVLQLEYGFNLRKVGLNFISVIIGYILSLLMFVVIDKTIYARVLKAGNGYAAPEHRLYIAMTGSVLLPAGLFWYSWEAHRGGHWAAVVASGIPFGCGAFSIFLATIVYMSEVYGTGAIGSALAANGTLRYVLGATFPLFTIQMYQNLGIHWAGSLYAFLSLGLLPIPWILFKYGPQLRAASRFSSAAGKLA